MKVNRLSENEAANLGFNYQVELTHADLTDADTQQTIALLNVAAGDIVSACATKLVTPFEDTADTAVVLTTLIIGDDADTDRFLVSQELNLNGTEIDFKAGPPTTQHHAYNAANTIDAIIDVTAAKTCLQLDKGEIHIFFKIAKLNSILPPIV